MKSIPMPKVSFAKCDECGSIAEYYFNEYGALESCDRCNSAPINLTRVNVTKA
jgi:hypothetical protein